MKRIWDYILIFIVVGVMLIPIVTQFLLSKEKIEPLNGTFEYADSLSLSWDSWSDKSWQENREELLKKNLNIKPSVVRIQHEIDYKLFSEYHMGDLLVGKDDYYFSKGWSNSRCCINTLNIDSLSDYMTKVKELSLLFKKKGKYLRIIIVPSKEEIFADKLPDDFAIEKLDNAYHLYTNELEKNKIEYWDLLDYYKSILDTSSYPVYSKTSVHWTSYGASFTLLRLLSDMNSFFNKKMATIYIRDSEVSKFKKGDGDTETTLNLLNRIDNSDFLYYYYAVNSNDSVFKPKVLTIADSYYWGLKSSWVLPDIYSLESKFLYYYSTVFYPTTTPPSKVKDLNIVEEFKTADAVIILNSSHNLKGFPFGLQYDIDEIITGLKELPDK